MNRLLWNFVTANIIPRASFSIWEYCFSDGNRDLEACTTVFREPSGSLWRVQAPMLYELASLATIGRVEGEIRSKGFLDLFE